MLPNYGYFTKCANVPVEFPPQYQPGQPGIESIMVPRPVSENPSAPGSGKLHGKVALITGGDSGIGRAVAYLFAKEGADLAIVYLNEHGDALETQNRVVQWGRRCMTIAGDIGYEPFCRHAVQQTAAAYGRIDILVNTAGELHYRNGIGDITSEQLERTFRTNVFASFYFAKAVSPFMQPGSAIINTSSVASDTGFDGAIDYTASKGAVDAFTRALATSLIRRGIRVNAVAPGRTWTPLIPSAIPPELYMSYGYDTPIKRTAQPVEIAPAYLYLASADSSYTVGQTLHVNGGEFYGL
ncbi:SDR family oxidoreductase [Cohnella candidum]|uniref:SDR family oxidoreductase n=1 Tax=Cohnella candidum TaxID=2674991 RepID=A0A3G3JTA0_9BACL|nr:SDR family oxidoreductase [Cohnella candidum]AYQ71453.1 SDR family oxidoreductase [Cohnella candidum]